MHAPNGGELNDLGKMRLIRSVSKGAHAVRQWGTRRVMPKAQTERKTLSETQELSERQTLGRPLAKARSRGEMPASLYDSSGTLERGTRVHGSGKRKVR